MSHGKVFAVVSVLIALGALLSGLMIRTAYSTPQFHYEKVSSESFTMPANTTAYKSVSLNQQDSYEIIVNTPEDYTILSSSLGQNDLEKWQNGQFNVSWEGNFGGHSRYGLSGNCKTYYAELTGDQALAVQNLVFWNPDSFSKQVSLLVYRQGYEIDYASLNMGNMLLAGGSAGLTGVAMFFAVKNKSSIQITPKKALILIVSMLLVASGIYIANAYSGPVEGQSIVNQGAVSVPAHGCYPLACVINQAGTYIIQLDVDRGTIQSFYSGNNSTIGYWSNGTQFDIRDEYMPSFNGSSGMSGSYAIDGEANVFPYTQYHILSNVDDYSKNVTYQTTIHWTYNNYFAMMTGIAMLVFGVIAFVLTLLKGKLKDFNKALEKSEAD